VSEIRRVIVGTAGHIDHGKSSLVRFLTGVDPDRLDEERERGMTIDLGFAPYQHTSGATVGLIDVPGHERFIKNMVAGATSVDVVVLVVAADDGVMPQTREHLAILNLLGVQLGMVALSKVDLVDEELVEMALEDVREFVAGTFLDQASIVPISATTGLGMDELRQVLDGLVDRVEPHTDKGPFRLPVQRVFSVAGHGLVVTGVPISGKIAVGETLEVVRTGQRLRVRGIQAYGEQRDSGSAGHSAALNLAGGSKDDVRRGDVVSVPGLFGSSRFVALDYRHVDGQSSLRQRHPVRVHVGTDEVMGRATLLDGESCELESRHRVQLRLDDAVCCAVGDSMVLRDAASMAVLGGGRVLALTDGRLKRLKARVLNDLDARADAVGDPRALVLAALVAAGARGCSTSELEREAGDVIAGLLPVLQPSIDAGELLRVGSDHWYAGEALDALGNELVSVLKKAHKQQPLLDWLDMTAVRSLMSCSEAALRATIGRSRRVETQAGGRVRRSGHRGRLGDQLTQVKDRILSALLEGGAAPPLVDDEFTGLASADTRALIEMLREAGEVQVVGPFLFHTTVLDHMVSVLMAHGAEREGAIEIPLLRDALGTSRKYLIPLLEHFDATGLTARHGDRRVLRRGPRTT
jgi:selenocysteine-specific elongation factor